MRGAAHAGARRRPTAAIALAVTIAAAATVGLSIYLVGSSLPYLMSSPAGDQRFGELNQCLIALVPEARAGFAVSPDGGKVAAYGASALGICSRQKGSDAVSSRALTFPGVTSASYDFAGVLWLAAARGPRPELWRLRQDQAEPERSQGVAPIALAGHAHGVAAVEATGRMASISETGIAQAVAQLPPAAAATVQLSSNATGELVSVIAGRSLFVYRASDLSLVRAESPCEVEFLWWLADPARALLSCGPAGSWAMELNVSTGERETAPKRERVRSALVPLLRTYVQGCELLPCAASAP